MKDIEVNGAHITDESAEILTQWQTKTEPNRFPNRERR